MKRASLSLSLMCLWQVSTLFAQDPGRRDGFVLVGELRGPITSVTVEYVRKALAKSDQQRCDLVVFEMDTPGGMVTSTEEIIQEILASRVPVVVHVTPAGAQATSAGLYIANAADLIAMSPGTRIGAGHPVNAFGGSPGNGEKEGRDYMGEKIENTMAAGVRSIASRRGRNAEVYERMVRESISLTDREALEQKVIDLSAKDLDELMSILDGREVTRFDGSKAQISVARPRVERLELTMRQRILSWVADPRIAMVLLSIAVFGLYIEFNNPGLVVPGIVGGVALILFAISTQILPINLLGMLLIVLGIALFVLEIKFTSYGMLTTGGVAALTLGFLTLFDTEQMPDLRLTLGFILPSSLTLAVMMGLVTFVAVRAQRARVVTGVEGLSGEVGEAVTEVGADGKVFVHGEYWDAIASQPIARGRKVRVRAVRDMVLEVEPTDR